MRKAIKVMIEKADVLVSVLDEAQIYRTEEGKYEPLGKNFITVAVAASELKQAIKKVKGEV